LEKNILDIKLRCYQFSVEIVKFLNTLDIKRINYLDQHIKQVFRARHEGVNVNGYFAWSLIDNFEWKEGYRPKFGLVHIDFNTQQRIIKESGYWYSKLIQNNNI